MESNIARAKTLLEVLEGNVEFPITEATEILAKSIGQEQAFLAVQAAIILMRTHHTSHETH